MFSSIIKNLKIREQRAKTEYAELKVAEQRAWFRPSRNWPINVFREGSRWVCVSGTHPDLSKNVIAYGDSPDQAIENFDNLWNGIGEFLEFEEEEEEF